MKFQIAFIVLLTSTSAFSLELSMPPHILRIPPQTHWQLGKDLFGIPFTYFSQRSNNQRSNIIFSHTGAEIDLKKNDLINSQNAYKELKNKWAINNDAKVQKFIPYHYQKNQHGHSVHSIGVKYLHENKNYVETSYYIECRGQIVFSKSLRISENQEHEKNFNEIINQLDCGVI